MDKIKSSVINTTARLTTFLADPESFSENERGSDMLEKVLIAIGSILGAGVVVAAITAFINTNVAKIN
ncbi:MULTISPECIES: hypothetical protein [unclassified Leucobacter]|uniref:hypothetical protein n=1 Tax=unclassified Leucobacter TaxID=2621730 RepID=UPI0030187F23